MKSTAARKDEFSPHLEESGEATMSDPVESRLARIESDVQHIAADTADLRVELRRTNDKIDNGFKELLNRMDSGFKDLGKRIDDTNRELGERIEDVNTGLGKRIDDTNKELITRTDSLKEKLHSLSVRGLLLYVTLAGGLLTVIAHAFKWL
jgi:uncharacterized protein YPO0396